VVLLSLATVDRRFLPSLRTMEAIEGYTLLRMDVNDWIYITTGDEQNMVGGGTIVPQARILLISDTFNCQIYKTGFPALGGKPVYKNKYKK
jgi:hypothetical protein